ncbi:PIN domain-containing protein [Demequina maris]|uniref:PIN domain-containing protein n=1 Tax=Demequina maris TaxID=1638982 RepID=UPI0007813E53|nr:hypothetical protein [Demequina maris]
MADPISLGSVIGLAARVGATAIIPILKSRVARWQVARRSARRLRSRGIAVNAAMLRRWMRRPDVQEQLAQGRHKAIESAQASLAARLPAGPDVEGDALVVIGTILENVQATSNAAQASALTYRWLSNQLDSQRDEIIAWLESREAVDRRARVEAKIARDILGAVHPWLREDVTRLTLSDEAFRALMSELAQSINPLDLLQRWAAEDSPRLNDVSPEALITLAEVANTHGAQVASAAIARTARLRGAEPAEYLVALEAMARDWRLRDEVDELKSMLSLAPRVHPFGEALLLAATDVQAALTLLRAYDPPTPFVGARRTVLEARILAFDGDLRSAAAVITDAVESQADAAGLGVMAAEYLANIAVRNESATRANDLSYAVELAIGGRNARRAWRGTSAHAVRVAVDICALIGDWDRALELCTLPPEGQATPAEAADPEVVEASARLHVIRGNPERALAIATKGGDPHTAAVVRALSADADGDTLAARAAWQAAWQTAESPRDKLSVALNLALAGADLPPLGDLGSEYADAVDEVVTIHRAMTSEGGDRLTRLQASATKSWRIAMLTADEEATHGDLLASAATLKDAARRWQEPTLMRQAAGRFLQGGDAIAALDACDTALASAPANWHERLATMKVRFEALEQLGRRDEALDVARTLVAEAPDDAGARWALAHGLARRGDAQQAWNVLNPNRLAVDARTFDEARLWVQLAALAASEEHFVFGTIRLADQWANRGCDVSPLVAQILLRPSSSEDSPEEFKAAIQGALRRHVHDNPDSALTFITGKSDDDVAAAIIELMREQAPSPELRALAGRVARGELPVGLLAEIKHVTVSEVLASELTVRHAFADETLPEVFVPDVTAPVVADLTAISTIALVEPSIADILLGYIGNIELPDGCLVDAVEAEQSVSRSSATLYVSDDGEPHVTEVTEADRVRRAAQVGRMAELMRASRLVGWTVPSDAERHRWKRPWMLPLEYASDHSRRLWCDDIALRVIARERGIATFTTDDLLRHGVRRGDIDAALAEHVRALLIHHHYVDIAVNADTLHEAAALSGWRPEGAATSLTRAAAWHRSASVSATFLFEAVGHVAERPKEVSSWFFSGAFGLLRASPEEASAARNLELLVVAAFEQPWMSRDVLPYVVAGLRDAAAEYSRLSGRVVAVDLAPALRRTHERLLAQWDRPQAAVRLLSLVAGLEEQHRQCAVREVLLAD